MSQELAVTEGPVTDEAIAEGRIFLLTPAEVASVFRVDPKTVTRWAKAGKLTSIRTLGGHRRYLAHEVRALLEETLRGGLAASVAGHAFGALPALEAPRA